MSSPTLNNLAETIAQAANTITSYLESNDHPTPSFSENGPHTYPKALEVQDVRFKLLDALSDMTHLALGPEAYSLLQPAYSNHDMMVLDIINQFDFISIVPLGGSASYSEIALATTIPEPFVRRVLRLAFTIRLFTETKPGSGQVVHTATTAYLARYPAMRSMISHMLEELRLADYYIPESLRKYSAGKADLSQEISESGFAIADIDKTGHPTSFWEYIKRTPEGKPEGFRANRFSEAMQAITAESPINSFKFLREGYDWASLGEAIIVDVGGSSGHDAVLLAQSFPKLSFIVQDLPEVEPSFRSYVPKELLGQITFQPHSFFNPQTVSADVYMLKFILHDWPDKYAIKILQNIVPKLKSTSRIILSDQVFPSPDANGKYNLPTSVLHMFSAMDLHMAAKFNSLERSLEEWQRVIKQADERLEAQIVASSPESTRGMIEITLRN